MKWLLDGLAGLSTKHGHLCFYGNCVVCKADDSSATALSSSDASKALYEIMRIDEYCKICFSDVRVESRLKETTSRLEQQLLYNNDIADSAFGYFDQVALMLEGMAHASLQFLSMELIQQASIGPLKCWRGGLCLSRSIGDRDVGEFIIPVPHDK
uniref:Uncharacterized protein n=1 Tax=Lactuca sativa TaxID=4236 RepID=A0A9R1W6P7_LACSA|nr:hypothetical protein LSAT_V11C300110050 [Lactuca sativa]